MFYDYFDRDNDKDNYLDREKEAIKSRDSWAYDYPNKDDLDYMQHKWEQD